MNEQKEINLPLLQVGPSCGDFQGDTSTVIQQAIAALPAAGGTVEILPGVYFIDRSIRLRSNVHLIGHGKETILRKSAGCISALALDADYGQLKVTLENPAGFQPGMDVLIKDQGLDYYDSEVNTIIGIRGNTLLLNEYLTHNILAGGGGGNISNSFPMISGLEVENILISDLVLEGTKESNQFISGCRGGAIYLYKARRSTIRNCHVRNFNGDGISFQITQYVIVENCLVEGCTNIGMHPGTGTSRTQVRHCILRRNGTAGWGSSGGLYICYRVQEGLFEDILCEDNIYYGISIGHKDTDNVFRNCIFRRNSRVGILFRKEKFTNAPHRNQWDHCTVEDNGSSEDFSDFSIPNGIGIYIQGEATDNVFKNCQVRETRLAGKRYQRLGVQIEESAQRFQFEQCEIGGHSEHDFNDNSKKKKEMLSPL